jgi:signal transduction histidine kinase
LDDTQKKRGVHNATGYHNNTIKELRQREIMHRLLKRLNVYVLAALLIFTPLCGFGQKGYRSEHFTGENGLPQNTIKSISADNLGFLWLATDGGIVRFDGRQFQTYSNNLLKLTNAASVYCIEPVHRARPPGVSRNLQENRFDHGFAIYDSGESVRIENGKAFKDTSYIAEYLRIKNHFAPHESPYSITGIPDVFGASIPKAGATFTDGTGLGSFYWCTTDSVKQFTKWKITAKTANQVDNLFDYFILNNKLYHFNKISKSFTRIDQGLKSHLDLRGDILAHPFITQRKPQIKLYCNPNSRQTFLLLGDRLYLLTSDGDGNLTTTLLVQGFDFKGNDIDVVFYARKTNKLYLGSRIAGLFALTLTSFESVIVQGNDRPNIIHGQIALDSLQILTPTGILIASDNRGQIVRTEKPALRKVNPSDKQVITRDAQGNIWTKNRNTLIKMTPDANQVISQIQMPDLIKGICPVSDTQICVSVYKRGLLLMNTNTAAPGMYFLQGNYSKNISCLSYRGRDQLLVGTNMGLLQVNLRDKAFRVISGTEGLPIRSINTIAYNDVWITAQGKGLMMLNNEKGVFHFPADKDDYLASPHCVVDDTLGFLWVTTNRGLIQIKKTDLIDYYKDQNNSHKQYIPKPLYLLHNMSEGFNTNEFIGGCSPCGLRKQDGSLSLPSLDGLVWFNPANIHPVLPANDIIIDRVEVNLTPIALHSDSITLPITPENVRFNFSTPYFGNPYNLEISYALVGVGSDINQVNWNRLRNVDEMFIQWPSLNAGKYELLIKVRTGFGRDSETIKKLYLIVPTVWYKTTWASMAMAILCLIAVVLGTQYYGRKKMQSIKKENLILEQLIFTRTESLRTTLAQLEASNTEINNQMFMMSRMLASISHDVQSPLNYIVFSSTEIPNLLANNQYKEASKVIQMIASISERTGQLLQDLLNYLKVQVYGKRVHIEEISIPALILEKLEMFKNAIDQKQNRVIFDIPADFIVHDDRLLLSIIIHNLIDNATKYTHQGEISFHTADSGGFKELIISNTGSPLSPESVALFNDVKKENIDPYPLTGGGSLGLIIVKEIAQFTNVQISIVQTDQINFHLRFRRPVDPATTEESSINPT